MTIETFLSDWESKSTQSDSNSYIRNHENLEVSIYQSARDDSTIRLSSIRSTKPKNKEASKFLKWITKQADKHQVKITSCITPFGWKRETDLDKDKLKAWFTKNGFVIREKYPEDWGYEMIRNPK